MREYNIINSARDREGEMVPGEVLTRKRWLEFFPEITEEELKRFVKRMKDDGGSKFCVSRVEGKTTRDPNLMLFRVETGENQKPDIVFVGKGNIGGSVRVYNQFAAETNGFWVLVPNSQEL